MLKKSYTKTGQTCRVTFKLPAETSAETALLCGEFTDWETQAKPMKMLKKGDSVLPCLCRPANPIAFAICSTVNAGKMTARPMVISPTVSAPKTLWLPYSTLHPVQLKQQSLLPPYNRRRQAFNLVDRSG